MKKRFDILQKNRLLTSRREEGRKLLKRWMKLDIESLAEEAAMIIAVMVFKLEK